LRTAISRAVDRRSFQYPAIDEHVNLNQKKQNKGKRPNEAEQQQVVTEKGPSWEGERDEITIYRMGTVKTDKETDKWTDLPGSPGACTLQHRILTSTAGVSAVMAARGGRPGHKPSTARYRMTDSRREVAIEREAGRVAAKLSRKASGGEA
jgi:hypothetical protein